MAAIAQPAPQQPPVPQLATPPKTDWAPTAKVSVGVLAAALTTLLLPVLKHFEPNLTVQSSAALTSVLTFIIQYLVPERKWTFGA